MLAIAMSKGDWLASCQFPWGTSQRAIPRPRPRSPSKNWGQKGARLGARPRARALPAPCLYGLEEGSPWSPPLRNAPLLQLGGSKLQSSKNRGGQGGRSPARLGRARWLLDGRG